MSAKHSLMNQSSCVVDWCSIRAGGQQTTEHYPSGLNEHRDGGETSEGDSEDEEYGCSVERYAGEDEEWVRFARGGRRDFAVPVLEFRRFPKFSTQKRLT